MALQIDNDRAFKAAERLGWQTPRPITDEIPSNQSASASEKAE